MPLVSVIIPTYNRAAMLREALESIRWQTVKDVEVIVVDDGSTDQTERIIRSYGGYEIMYLRQENQGVAAARNLGIVHASGQCIAFLDSDDLWLPHKLERQLDELHEHPEVGLFYARMWSYDVGDPTRRRLDPSVVARSFSDLLNGPNAITTSTVLVRRACFDAVGLFNTSLRASEDHELWLRIARRFAIGFIDEPLAEYRRHPDSINTDHAMLYEGYRGFYDILLREYRDQLKSPRAAERQLAKFEYLCGTAALRRRDARAAVRLIGKGLSRDAALGRQFIRNDTPWPMKTWLPLKPYAAFAVSAVRSLASDSLLNE